MEKSDYVRFRDDSDRRAWRAYAAAALGHLNLYDTRTLTAIGGHGLITEHGADLITELSEPDEGWAERHAGHAAQIADAMLTEEKRRR